MKCDEMEILISAYVDGETSDDETRSVGQHLDICPHCQAVLAEFRDVQVLCGEMSRVDAPKGFRQRVTQRIDNKPKQGFIQGFPTIVYALSLTLCVLVIGGVSMWYSRGGPSPETTVEVVDVDIHIYAEDVLFGESPFQETDLFSASEGKSTEDMLEVLFGDSDTSWFTPGKAAQAFQIG